MALEALAELAPETFPTFIVKETVLEKDGVELKFFPEVVMRKNQKILAAIEHAGQTVFLPAKLAVLAACFFMIDEGSYLTMASVNKAMDLIWSGVEGQSFNAYRRMLKLRLKKINSPITLLEEKGNKGIRFCLDRPEFAQEIFNENGEAQLLSRIKEELPIALIQSTAPPRHKITKSSLLPAIPGKRMSQELIKKLTEPEHKLNDNTGSGVDPARVEKIRGFKDIGLKSITPPEVKAKRERIVAKFKQALKS